MKRFAAILMLSIFAINFAGSYVYFFFRSLQIRNEMRAVLLALSDEKLAVVHLTLQEYQAARVDDGELKLNGQMFDIARTEKSADEIVVYGLFDEAEDNLLSLVNTILDRAREDNKPLPSSIAGFLALIYLPSENNFGPIVSSHDHLPTPYVCLASVFYLNFETPPPRF